MPTQAGGSPEGLLPSYRGGVVYYREYGLKTGYLEDLPHGGARSGENELSALFAYPAQGRE